VSGMNRGESIEKLGGAPDRCLPVRIAEATGMPLAVVLKVIGGAALE
jgi:hypothetical protein